MTTLRQAAQQALEALETLSKLGNGKTDGNSIGNTIAQDARTALREALMREHALHDLARLGQEIEQQAKPCIGKDPRCPCQDGDACHYKDCGSTKALPVPVAQPEQEPTPWRDMVVVSLVREGINKHKARELADHFAAQRQWVKLTDEEINAVYEQAEVLVHDSWVGSGTVGLMFPITLYKMFEAKLKERNT